METRGAKSGTLNGTKVEKAADLWEQGKNTLEIADHIGVVEASVWKALSRIRQVVFFRRARRVCR